MASRIIATSTKTLVAEKFEDCRKYSVLRCHAGHQVRCLRTPLAESVDLRRCSHEHRGPVGGAVGGKCGSFLQCVGSVLHQPSHIRHVSLGHRIGSPAVKSDEEDVRCRLLPGVGREHREHRDNQSDCFFHCYQILFVYVQQIYIKNPEESASPELFL